MKLLNLKLINIFQVQLTVFTSVAYFDDKTLSTVIVSDNLHHGKMSIVPFLTRLLHQFPDSVNKIDLWSDGPSSQFKNRYIVAALSLIQNLSKKQITWNYFASYHGKGAIDGIGGTIKRHVQHVVNQRVQNVQSSKSFERAARTCAGITCLQMDTAELVNFNEKHGLRAIFTSAKQIAGIKSMHKLYLDNNGTLVSHCYQGEGGGEENDGEDMEVNNEKEENDSGNVKDNEGNETTSSSSVSLPSSLQEMDIAKVKIGEWVVVQYEGEHSICDVTDTLINEECKKRRCTASKNHMSHQTWSQKIVLHIIKQSTNAMMCQPSSTTSDLGNTFINEQRLI